MPKPASVSEKYAYSDDLAIRTSARCWNQVEDILTSDMATFSLCSISITGGSRLVYTILLVQLFIFAKEKPISNYRFNSLPFELHPKLGLTLEKTLSFRKYTENLRLKVTARNGLIRRLAAISWDTSVNTLRTSILMLAYSTAEYCATVWGRRTCPSSGCRSK